MGNRVSTIEHAAVGWRLAEVAPDFELIDAWVLPVRGEQDQFEDLVRVWNSFDPGADAGSPGARFLFRLRDRLGRWFGWDDDLNTLPIPGCEETSLRDRLPLELPALVLADPAKGPFRPVFGTPAEWTAELSNSTVHAVLQLGWVPGDDGAYHGRLGVYVKTRSWFGRMYMAAIAPFRHYVVYPALLRKIGRAWQRRDDA